MVISSSKLVGIIAVWVDAYGIFSRSVRQTNRIVVRNWGNGDNRPDWSTAVTLPLICILGHTHILVMGQKVSKLIFYLQKLDQAIPERLQQQPLDGI